eukprot:1140718-Pelagomonas_calceolata.AAC.4
MCPSWAVHELRLQGSGQCHWITRQTSSDTRTCACQCPQIRHPGQNRLCQICRHAGTHGPVAVMGP